MTGQFGRHEYPLLYLGRAENGYQILVVALEFSQVVRNLVALLVVQVRTRILFFRAVTLKPQAGNRSEPFQAIVARGCRDMLVAFGTVLSLENQLAQIFPTSSVECSEGGLEHIGRSGYLSKNVVFWLVNISGIQRHRAGEQCTCQTAKMCEFWSI